MNGVSRCTRSNPVSNLHRISRSITRLESEGHVIMRAISVSVGIAKLQYNGPVENQTKCTNEIVHWW